MARFVNCGIYNNGIGLCNIYADTITGELIIQSDLQGNCYMSELTVLDPIQNPGDDVLQKVMKHFEADGVILSDRHLITLKDEQAYYRNYADNTKVENVIAFDTDMQCDISSFDTVEEIK